VRFYDADKGFGFLTKDEGGDVYVRSSALPAGVTSLKTGQKVEFTQDEFTLRLTGMPLAAPDNPATVIEVECDAEPTIDHQEMRSKWPREKVGISV